MYFVASESVSEQVLSLLVALPVATQTQKKAICQTLSKFKAPKTFDSVVLLLEIYYTYTSCVKSTMYKDIYCNIVCDLRD